MQIKTFTPTSHKIKALVYGASGSGKTYFGGTAPKPIFASAEGGLLSIAEKSPAFVEIKTLKDLIEMLDYLKNQKHEYETVVIDSITEINDIIKLEIERKNGRDMQQQDWGNLLKRIKSILRGFRDLPMHVLLIAQEKNEMDEAKINKVVPSLNGQAATDIAYFMDVVGHLSVDAMGNRLMTTLPSPRLLSKDRTPGTLIGNNTAIDFSEWVRKMQNIKTGSQDVIESYEPKSSSSITLPTEEQLYLLQWFIEQKYTDHSERLQKLEALKTITKTQAEHKIKAENLRYENGNPVMGDLTPPAQAPAAEVATPEPVPATAIAQVLSPEPLPAEKVTPKPTVDAKDISRRINQQREIQSAYKQAGKYAEAKIIGETISKLEAEYVAAGGEPDEQAAFVKSLHEEPPAELLQAPESPVQKRSANPRSSH